MTAKTLTAATVEDVFFDCLFREGEDTSAAVLIEGIVTNVGFHPGRLEQRKAEISELLDWLPSTFKESDGGGMSFLNGCYDRNERLWTGMQSSVEQLFLLGLATGRAKYLVPRGLWEFLPGGVPYFLIVDK